MGWLKYYYVIFYFHWLRLFAVLLLLIWFAVFLSPAYAVKGTDIKFSIPVQCTEEPDDTDSFPYSFNRSSQPYPSLQSSFIYRFLLQRHLGGDTSEAMTQLPTLSFAVGAGGMDALKVQQTLANESLTLNKESVETKYPDLARSLGTAIESIDKGLALTDMGLSVLNSLCQQGSLTNDFVQSLFNNNVVSYLSPIKVENHYKNVAMYLSRDNEAMEFLANIDKPLNRDNVFLSGTMEAKPCVRVFVSALYQFSQKSDKVFETIIKYAKQTKDLTSNFEHSPVCFVIIALATNPDTRDVLVNTHDSYAYLEEDREELANRLEGISNSTARNKMRELRLIIKYRVMEYFPPLKNKDQDREHLFNVVDHIIFALKYQRKLSYALYGLPVPVFSGYGSNCDEDHRVRLYRFEDLLKFVKTVSYREKWGILLALIEYPKMFDYLYKECLDVNECLRDNKKAIGLLPYFATALSQSIHLYNCHTDDALEGDAALVHAVFFAVLAAQVELFKKSSNRLKIPKSEGWMREFIHRSVDVGLFSNYKDVADELRIKWLTQYESEPEEPKSEEKWNEFYQKLAVAVMPAYLFGNKQVKKTKHFPTMSLAVDAGGMDALKVQQILTDESLTLNKESVETKYPDLARSLGTAIESIDKGLALTDMGLSVLNSLCQQGSLTNDFVQSLFNSNVVSYLSPIKVENHYKNVAMYLSRDNEAMEFLANIDKPLNRDNVFLSGTMEAKPCVRVFVSALYQFSQKSDKVFETIIKYAKQTKDLTSNFEHSPVCFVIIALATNPDTRDVLVNTHDRYTYLEEDREKLVDRLEGISNSDTRLRWEGLRGIITSEVVRYFPPLKCGNEEGEHLLNVVDHIIFTLKYQRKLSYALYGFPAPVFSDYDYDDDKEYRVRLRMLEDLLLIANVHNYEIMGALLALIEYPEMFEYLYNECLKDSNNSQFLLPYFTKALSQSIHFYHCNTDDALEGDAALVHAVFFAVLAVQVELFKKPPEMLKMPDSEGWMSEFVHRSVGVDLYYNCKDVADKLRMKWLTEYDSEPEEPKSEEEWNEFYQKLAVAVMPAYLFDNKQVKKTKDSSYRGRATRESKATIDETVPEYGPASAIKSNVPRPDDSTTDEYFQVEVGR